MNVVFVLWKVARAGDTEHSSVVVVWASCVGGRNHVMDGKNTEMVRTQSHQGISLSFSLRENKQKNMFLRDFVQHSTLEAAGL